MSPQPLPASPQQPPRLLDLVLQDGRNGRQPRWDEAHAGEPPGAGAPGWSSGTRPARRQTSGGVRRTWGVGRMDRVTPNRTEGREPDER